MLDQLCIDYTMLHKVSATVMYGHPLPYGFLYL